VAWLGRGEVRGEREREREREIYFICTNNKDYLYKSLTQGCLGVTETIIP
jgi:hypothetical protein